MTAIWNNVAFMGNGVWDYGKRAVVAVKQNPLKVAKIIIKSLFAGAIIYKSYSPASDFLTGRVSPFMSTPLEVILWKFLGIPLPIPLDLEAVHLACSTYPALPFQLSSRQGIELDREIFEITNKYKLSEDQTLKELALQAEETCKQGRKMKGLLERLLHSQPDSVRHDAIEEYHKKSSEFSQSPSLTFQQYAQVINYLAIPSQPVIPSDLQSFIVQKYVQITNYLAVPSQTVIPSDLKSAYDICFNYFPALFFKTSNLRDEIINTIDKYKLSEDQDLKELALQAEEMCEQVKYLDAVSFKLVTGLLSLKDNEATIEEFYKKYPEFSQSLSPEIRGYANKVAHLCASFVTMLYVLYAVATTAACAFCVCL